MIGIYVYIYYGSCAMRFGLCLDFVIGFCGYSTFANAMQSFDSMFPSSLFVFVENFSTIMFMNHVLQNPCNAGMV